MRSIVLAVGDASRLKELRTTAAGDTIPKQFCSLNRLECLLQLALQRAAAISSSDQVSTVVAVQHRRWRKGPLGNLPTANVVVQPSNRGTAVGAALALLHIEKQNPEASVVLLPADHYVQQESVLAKSLRHLSEQAWQDTGSVFLLGAEPDCADAELGYIVPSGRSRDAHGACGVSAFVEKPPVNRAQELQAAGALWNMFIVAGALPVLLSLFGQFYNILDPMRSALREPAGSLARLYSDLLVVDFSRDLLAHYPQKLKFMSVPACGRTDLGTPKRVAEIMQESVRYGTHAGTATDAMFLDLAHAVGQQ